MIEAKCQRCRYHVKDQFDDICDACELPRLSNFKPSESAEEMQIPREANATWQGRAEAAEKAEHGYRTMWIDAKARAEKEESYKAKIYGWLDKANFEKNEYFSRMTKAESEARAYKEALGNIVNYDDRPAMVTFPRAIADMKKIAREAIKSIARAALAASAQEGAAPEIKKEDL
jgi:hypothetical protein